MLILENCSCFKPINCFPSYLRWRPSVIVDIQVSLISRAAFEWMIFVSRAACSFFPLSKLARFPFLISLSEIKFPEIKFVDYVVLKIQRVNEMRYYCFLLDLAVFNSLQALRWTACTESGDISWTVLVFSQLALGKKARAIRNAIPTAEVLLNFFYWIKPPTVCHFTGSILALELQQPNLRMTIQFNSIFI